MFLNVRLLRMLLAGVLAEGVILLYAFLTIDGAGEVFRHAARYSGRLSFVVFIAALVLFAVGPQRTGSHMDKVRRLVLVFAVLHFIHLGFLALNVYLNGIELVPFKLAGGFLAYLLILLYPILFSRLGPRSWVHLVFFLYVGMVMMVTFLARINGDFEGATASWFHYFGFVSVLIGCTTLVYRYFTGRPEDRGPSVGQLP